MYDPVLVRAALLDLSVTLGDRIRGRGQIAHGLTLSVRLAGGATAQRTKRLPQPSAHTEDLRTAVLRLLDAMAFQRARIRRLTLIAEDLRPTDEGPGTQLSLDDAREMRAIARLHALWLAWQELTDPATCGYTGPSVWHRDHLDPCPLSSASPEPSEKTGTPSPRESPPLYNSGVNEGRITDVKL
ncbi:DinB/UmuC family translesion DNA polymerase [Streptomyces gardneri]|uniref:DinB/UmuC family translesion DNA polymerase n=1 Tax=Streptomyces gardneri TaxID=66892 RepID=UPI0035DB9E61